MIKTLSATQIDLQYRPSSAHKTPSSLHKNKSISSFAKKKNNQNQLTRNKLYSLTISQREDYVGDLLYIFLFLHQFVSSSLYEHCFNKFHV